MRFLSDFRLVICLQISLPVNSASAYTLNADFRFKKSKFSVFRLVKTGNPSSLENPLLVVPKCFFSKCSFSTEYFLTSGGRKIPHLNIFVSFPPITEDRALVVWMNDKLVYVICKSWALVYQDKGTQKQTHTHTLTHTHTQTHTDTFRYSTRDRHSHKQTHTHIHTFTYTLIQAHTTPTQRNIVLTPIIPFPQQSPRNRLTKRNNVIHDFFHKHYPTSCAKYVKWGCTLTLSFISEYDQYRMTKG